MSPPTDLCPANIKARLPSSRQRRRAARSGRALLGQRTAGVVLVWLVTAGLLLATPVATPAQARLRCATSGKTVVSNSVARVFTVYRPKARLYFGCVREVGRVNLIYRAWRDRFPSYLKHPRLGGHYFAAETYFYESHGSSVQVWNLTRGREIWSGSSASTSDGEAFLFDLEVTRRGAIAWLPDEGEDGISVMKVDGRGLASLGWWDANCGAEPAIGHLELKDRTVSWCYGGTIFSYVLHGRP
jgi:hypothetical protein